MPRRKASDPLRGMYQRNGIWWLSSDGRGHKIKPTSLGTREIKLALDRAAAIRRDPVLCAEENLWGDMKKFIKEMQETKEWRAHSVNSKSTTLRKFCEFVNFTPAAKVTTAYVEEYYKYLQEPYTPKRQPPKVATDTNGKDGTRKRRKRKTVEREPIEHTRTSDTVHSYLSVVRSFFKWCVNNEIVRENPVDRVKRIKYTPKARVGYCTAAQRDKLIENCTDPELKLILFLGFHCGLRKSEIIAARPSWFDLRNGTLTLQGTEFKNRTGRFVPLSTPFRNYLETITLPSPRVIAPNKRETDNRGLYRYDFERKFRTYVCSQGIPTVQEIKFTPHIMRHTFASLLMQAGVSTYKVAKWMGDLEKTVSKHYGHLAPTDRSIDKAF